MKMLAVTVAAAVSALMMFPVLFASGDGPHRRCASGTEIEAVLATIRTLESGGDYTARAARSSASGAYQFIDSTWNNYDGYPSAWHAPPHVQDAKAAEHIHRILDTHDDDITAIPVVWYLGHLPTHNSALWDTVPVPSAGNTLTPRQYQQRWLNEYEHQIATTPTDRDHHHLCAAGSIAALADGYAYPGPPDLFANAPVDAPHHTYPAWDWSLPIGTPLYAVRGGTVVTVQHWPHNWWDHGCGTDNTNCQTCGIGVTIQDSDANRWAYCHADAVHAHIGDTIAAGDQILTSGNTGRSSGPHLHLQIRTPDGQLRCPQPLLRSLQTHAAGIDPAHLPTSGCYY